MGYLVIGDEQTVTGFRLAGIEGRAARTPYEAREALKAAAAAGEVSVVVITERLASAVKADVDACRARGKPLVVEIPDRGGPMEGRKTIRELVKAAVGVTV